MKRKFAALYAVLASAIMMQSVVYADIPVQQVLTYNAEAVETVEPVEKPAVADDETEIISLSDDSAPLSAYASNYELTYTGDSVDYTIPGTKIKLVCEKVGYQKKGGSEVYVAKGEGINIKNLSVDSKDISADIVIPDNINGLPVINIGEAAFDSCFLTSITVPSSVLQIEDRAFINCSRLKTLTILGAEDTPIFTKADGKTYKIPTVIGDNVVANSTALETVSIDGYETIGDSLFEGDTSLKNVDISISGFGVSTNGSYNKTARTISVGKRAFYNCSGLVNLDLGDSISKLGDNAFVGCKALKTLNIGAKVASGQLAYTYFVPQSSKKDSDFTKVYDNPEAYKALLDAEALEIDAGSCTALEEITVSTDNTSYSAVDGILYNKKQTELMYYPMNNAVKAVVLPETVTKLSNGAFYRHPNITSFTAIGTSALNIGNYAFYRSSVKTVDLNRTTTMTIGTAAFKDCAELTKFKTAYNTGGSIGSLAFMDCAKLDGELVLKGWASIGNYAFALCDSLTKVTADVGCGSVSDYVFARCANLEEADLSKLGKEVITTQATLSFGTYIFRDCPKLVKASVHDTLLGLSTGTFYNCEALETFECGEDIALISNYAFYNCKSLVSVPEIRFLVCIDKNAFEGCSSLPELKLTRSVLYIDSSSFKDCDKLSIVTPEGYAAETFAKENNIPYSYMNDDIKDYEFLCYSLVEARNDAGEITKTDRVVYPGSWLIDIGIKPEEVDLVLSGYRGGFTSLTIPTDDNCLATEMSSNWAASPLGDNTKCSVKKVLESVDFGKIVSIGDSAFSGCNVLANIVLSNEASNIGKSTFKDCKVLKGDISKNALVLPLTMKSIGESAFSGCVALENVDFDLENNVDKASGELNIGKLAFNGCVSLKTFNNSCKEYDLSGKTIPDYSGPVSVGENAFKNCAALEYFYFNKELSVIGPKCFESCAALEAVTIDNNVLLQTNAFLGCTNLTYANINGTVNGAISNDPFCSADTFHVITSDLSKAQEYVNYKKNQGKEFEIELGTFETRNGKAYLSRKVVPYGGIIVYKNGKVMDTDKESVIMGDKLSFEVDGADNGKEYSFFINDVLVGEEYNVPESGAQQLVITYKESSLYGKGDVNADGAVTATDSAWALQHALNPSSLNLDAAAIARADVDENNDVNANDSAMILQKALVSTFEFHK